MILLASLLKSNHMEPLHPQPPHKWNLFIPFPVLSLSFFFYQILHSCFDLCVCVCEVWLWLKRMKDIHYITASQSGEDRLWQSKPFISKGLRGTAFLFQHCIGLRRSYRNTGSTLSSTLPFLQKLKKPQRISKLWLINLQWSANVAQVIGIEALH